MTDSPDSRQLADDNTTKTDSTTNSGSGPTVRRKRRLATNPEPTKSEVPKSDASKFTDSANGPPKSATKRTRRIATGADSPKAQAPTTVRAKAAKDKPPKNPEKMSAPTRKRTRRVGAGGAGSTSASQSTAADAAASLPKPLAKPRIGDSRRAGESDAGSDNDSPSGDGSSEGAGNESDQGTGAEGANRKRRRGGRGRGRGKAANEGQHQSQSAKNGQRDQIQRGGQQNSQRKGKGRNNSGGGQRQPVNPVEANLIDERPVQLDDAALEKRRGQEHKGRPVGRYQMVVHVEGEVTHIAVLEGRTLIEHYVSRPADDVSQIHGNIYLGRVQNVLPGMEAAFIDIGTPKNAVLYRGDVSFDRDDVDSGDGKPSQPKGRKSRHRNNGGPRIEQLLKARQTIVCQVTKNPISHKGARLTTEVSLPGRFVVLVPNSSTYGISKRLSDKERRRLRRILDKVKPKGHGLIVRTAAEDVTAEEIERDVARLHQQWLEIEKLATSAKTPSILFREPDMAVRVIREEFTKEYRGVIIDDRALYEQVKSYMETITPALADRIEYHDRSNESLSVFERFHVGEQFRKAVDRKVWLPSGGSLIIEHTEALTVIDVNTGKNVGSTNLEATVFSNNLEAADEIAKQLRLRDIGGIIVIDFVDMEIKSNREEVMRVFRDALARDKTRTQAFDITDLGLVEMTRKRIGEGLLESVSCRCADCDGRGIRFLPEAIPE